MLLIAITSVTSSSRASLTELSQEQTRESVDSVTKAVEDYYLFNRTFPASIDALAASQGYGELQEYLGPTITAANAASGYSTVYLKPWLNSYTDPNSPLSPAYKDILIVGSNSGRSTSSTALSEGVSGTTTSDGCRLSSTFSELNPNWCQDRQIAISRVVSERNLYTKLLPKVVKQQEATAGLIIKRFLNITRTDTTSPTNSTALQGTIGTSSNLSSYVTANTTISSLFNGKATVGTTPITCKGVFRAFIATSTWKNPTTGLTESLGQQAFPLGCENLYNFYGNPVKYKKLSLDSFELTSDSAYRKSNGSFKVLTTTVTFTTTQPRTYTIVTSET